MLLTLPVETIEHIFNFLADDPSSLSVCASTCHGLVPIARTWLWQEVALPLDQYGACCHQRSKAFLGLLDSNPAIAHYIRSLILYPGKCARVGEGVPFDRATWDILHARLPALRSLRLRSLRMVYLYEVVELLRDRPTLEALYLEDVDLTASQWKVLVWPQPPTQISESAVDEPLLSLCALRTLSIVGGEMTGEEVVRLALFLEQAKRDLPRLDSLDFCCAMPHNFARYNRPQPGPGIPSYGASLRHFGVTFSEPPVSFRDLFDHCEHMQPVFSALPRCSSLTSLRLGYDSCNSAFYEYASRDRDDGLATPRARTQTPCFLELLADVLSTPGPAPLPLLESLFIVLNSPAAWIAGFAPSFARLAEVLVGDAGSLGDAWKGRTARRFPRFNHLSLRVSFLRIIRRSLGRPRPGDRDLEADERDRQKEVRINVVLPMLVDFVEAGVHVEVSFD